MCCNIGREYGWDPEKADFIDCVCMSFERGGVLDHVIVDHIVSTQPILLGNVNILYDIQHCARNMRTTDRVVCFSHQCSKNVAR